MKHGKKLTRGQKMILMRNGLDPADFFAVKGVGTGWLFRSKSDTDKFIVCYPDKDGAFEPDGTTPASRH